MYDIESDGDMDVFVGEYAADNVLFYENNNNLSWTKHIIDDKADGVAGLVIADFDSDGNMDILVGMEGADLVAWYKNDEGDPINWKKDTIDNDHDAPSGVWVEDINGDGDPDAISKLYGSGEMFWYENNLPVGWTPHLIGLNMQGGGAASIADMNGDNKPDLV